MCEWCAKIYMEIVNKELSAMKTNSRLYMNETEMEVCHCAIKVTARTHESVQTLLNKQEPI